MCGAPDAQTTPCPIDTRRTRVPGSADSDRRRAGANPSPRADPVERRLRPGWSRLEGCGDCRRVRGSSFNRGARAPGLCHAGHGGGPPAQAPPACPPAQTGWRQGGPPGGDGVECPTRRTAALDLGPPCRQTGRIERGGLDCPRDRADHPEKNERTPWLKVEWKIPPKANAAFVAAMEDVLDVYAR